MREKNKREIFKRSKEVLRNVGVGQKGTKFNYIFTFNAVKFANAGQLLYKIILNVYCKISIVNS